MEKSYEKLLKELDAAKLKAEQYKHRLTRLENRMEYAAKGQRRKRAHHLITRGAAVESIAPEVKEMDEVPFYSMMEEILNLPEAREIIERNTGGG